MKSIVSIVLFAVISKSLSVPDEEMRNKRQLGIFNLIRFPNDSCGLSGQPRGTCMTRGQCNFKGGRIVGSCAQGFGVCCLVTRTCDEEIRDNGTYFVNPDYPSPHARTQVCRLTVRKQNPKICQLRLDFDEFTTRGPSRDTGKCDQDVFVINGQDTNSLVPNLCGDNGGQHVYVDVGSTSGPFSLLMSTSDNGGGLIVPRLWKIKVTQLACDNPWRAPSGCLQYHTSVAGYVKSFNYGNARAEQMGYPSDLHYTICFRKEIGHCSAIFNTTGSYGVGEVDTSPASTGQSCNKDYLIIGETRYCGGTGFPNPTTDVVQSKGTGPLTVTFVSETTRSTVGAGTTPYSGFNITYRQSTCAFYG